MTTKEQQQLSPETRAKIIMLQRGITPRDIAKATGFCLGYVQRLYNGHTVTEKGKRKIEAVLGCPIWSHEESQQSKGQMNEDDPDSLRGLTVESLEQAIEAHRSKGKALARRAAALQEHRGTTGYDLIREAEELNQAMEVYHAGGEAVVKRAAFLKDRRDQRLMAPD